MGNGAPADIVNQTFNKATIKNLDMDNIRAPRIWKKFTARDLDSLMVSKAQKYPKNVSTRLGMVRYMEMLDQIEAETEEYIKIIFKKSTPEQHILNAMRKLYQLPVSPRMMKESSIGKCIKLFAAFPGQLGRSAAKLNQKWKDVRRRTRRRNAPADPAGRMDVRRGPLFPRPFRIQVRRQ